MSEYLNKIGLVKYNNNTYKPVGLTLYFSVRDPGLVSSDPRTNFFNYPWKSDSHWTYNNYGLGWYYNGRDEIAYTFNRKYNEISSYNPNPTSQGFVEGGFVYNVIPIHPVLLDYISPILNNSKRFYNPTPMYIFKPFGSDEVFRMEWDEDYRAYEDINDPLTYTYVIISGGDRIKLELDWCPESGTPLPPVVVDANIHASLSAFVSGYWTDNNQQQIQISGIVLSYPFINEGNINDIYSNQLQFNLKSPNISGLNDENLLCTNITEGTFYNIPGTDYITGICTTKMLFIDALLLSDKQYVYMRGLVKGNIEVLSGVLTNDIIGPSTIIKKVKIKQLQGTLKNISDLPLEIKYGLNYYYAWGWLYGVDNITYKNVWYKNEISGTLKSNSNISENQIYSSYNGILSVSIITNNGTEDIVNIVSGKFTKDENTSIITGYLEGVILPFSIKMKGYASGYYSLVDSTTIKPLQLSSVLYNKSVIGNDLRQILDIKYANTLGRKGLTHPDPLYGLNLNWSTKNYDPFNKPYMLLTWKIIEYKLNDEERDYNTSIPKNSVDLNTYILTDKDKIQKYYKSKIIKTNDQLCSLVIGNTGEFYVYWDRMPETGDFVIKCQESESSPISNSLQFKTQTDALIYIKHLCGISNLKLKDYVISKNEPLTSYVLDSSDLEIK